MIKKYNEFKIEEALKTECQTEGAIYNTDISNRNIKVDIELPFDLDIDEKEAELLEANIHNALELVMRPYFNK